MSKSEYVLRSQKIINIYNTDTLMKEHLRGASPKFY